MHTRLETKDHIGWIILDNPPYNSLTHPVFADIDQLTAFLEAPDIKAVIIRGKGKHFCSGADPDSFQALFGDLKNLESQMTQAKKLLTLLDSARVPTVAVITGSCLGAGLEIALACHFRFCSESAMLGFPESTHNLLPGLGGTVFGSRVVKRHHLIDLLLSGRMIRGEEAYELGLVHSLGSAKEIEEMAIEHLHSLTSKHSAELIHSVMQSIYNSNHMEEHDALVEESKLFCKLAGKFAENKGR